MIKFKENVTLNIVEEFDSETDEVISQVDEVFHAGEIVDAEVISETDDGYCDIEFGDGSIVNNVNRNLFDIIG